MNASVRRYGAALLISTLAFLLTYVLALWIEPDIFLFSFAAVVISAWYGGWGPGMLATAVSVLLTNYAFIPPYNALSFTSEALLRLGIFTLVAVLTGTLTEQRRRAEAAARAESARFQVVLRSIGDAVIVTDTAGRITLMNEVAETLTGWAQADALGQDLITVFSIVNGTTGEPVANPVVRVLQEGVVVGLANDTVLVARDGTRRPIDDSGAPLRDDQGAVHGAVLIFRDVTERQQAEDALRRSRDQLAIILRDVADGITVQDRTGKLVYANDRAAQSIGFPSAQALLDTPIATVLQNFEIMDEAGNPLPLDQLPGRLALRGVRSPEVLVRFRVRATGAERWSLVSATPVFDEQGAVEFAVNVWHDVTERQRLQIGQRFLLEASTALASSLDYETTLSKIAQLAVPTLADWCMIDVVGEDGTPQRLVAVHRDPAKQAFLQELRRRYPTDVAAPHGYAKVIRTGAPELLTDISDAVLEAVAKDAEHLKMLRELGFTSNLCVPLIAREHILGAITLAMAESGRRFDAADLALAEEVARRAALALDNARLYLEAQDAIQMRDDFLSIASHELKTPVTSLLGYSQTLLRRATKQRPYTFTERDEKALQVIVEQTRRLHTQIDALLDIGRLQRGAFSTNRQPMNICDLVEQVVGEFKPLLDHHTIELICDEGGLIVDGDKDRLEQVLQNLLQNAVKYSPDGGRITVQVDQQDTQVCISVSDQGLGIPAAAQSLVFQPFYRAPMQGQPMIQGTGIGLYVVKEIVTLHGGTIELQSAEGQGSTFRVRLPLVAPVSPAKSA